MGLNNSCTKKTKWIGGVRCRAQEFPELLPLSHLESMKPCSIMSSQRMEFTSTQKPNARATRSFRSLKCSSIVLMSETFYAGTQELVVNSNPTVSDSVPKKKEDLCLCCLRKLSQKHKSVKKH